MRKAREAPAGCSPAEELLLIHLIQTAARRRLGNAGNGRCTGSTTTLESSMERARRERRMSGR
jgi:hypothetical protein